MPDEEYQELKTRLKMLESFVLDAGRKDIMLKNTLNESQRRDKEISALLKGSRAILKHRKFEDAARAIFDSCKELTGATSGYVALLSKDGAENEVLFLDPGGQPCTVNPSLPMPIRGLRGEAYSLGRTVYDNNFHASEWQQYMPDGHMKLENILFAPLILEEKAVGLLGLANKQGGFTEDDAKMASAFGDLAAVALMNSRRQELLETSERKYHNLVENALVGVYQSNLRGDVLYANEALLRIYEFESLEDFISERARARYKNPADREVLLRRLEETGRVTNFEIEALTKCGNSRNVLLSATLEGDVLSGIVTDITGWRKAEEEREKLIAELQNAVANIKTLSGLLPICSYCKKIRDDNGYWKQLESYITAHSEALFSHGMCPECAEKAFKELEEWKKKNTESGSRKPE